MPIDATTVASYGGHDGVSTQNAIYHSTHGCGSYRLFPCHAFLNHLYANLVHLQHAGYVGLLFTGDHSLYTGFILAGDHSRHIGVLIDVARSDYANAATADTTISQGWRYGATEDAGFALSV